MLFKTIQYSFILLFQLPRRFHGGEKGGGYHHGWSHRSNHYDYTDDDDRGGTGKETSTDSLKSTKSGKGAAGKAACCGISAWLCFLIWILILAALLLAIGLGFLTYYLLMNCKYLLRMTLFGEYFSMLIVYGNPTLCHTQ